MKKLISLILSLMLLASLAACGSGKTATDSAPADVTQAQEAEEAAVQSANDIDIDLTTMSATMVFSEVQNMMLDPKSYLGKTVKMTGNFSVAEAGDNRYFACIIADATACCAQGIEFDWAGDHSYPADYPEKDSEITVTGVFTTYMEGQQTYLQLKDADLQF